MSKILIVDDDKALCRSLQIQLQAESHQVYLRHTMESSLEFLRDGEEVDLVLLDVNLPDGSGLERLPDILAIDPEACIVIMTGDSDNRAIVDAMKSGAFDYLRKPLDLNDLFSMVAKAEQRRRTSSTSGEQRGEGPGFDDMIGSDPKIIDLLKQIGLLSRSRITVLIRGESGTGKELAARILHEASAPGKPFVAINCSAVVPTLLESELFGYEKGAFTGADRTKVGKFEYAADGTVFLDEIGDMPYDLQSKLLRVLQEDEFVRVGGLEPIPLRARVVAATHRDLERMVAEGKFRQDLFYRLNVSTLQIPPLQERKGDIPSLVEGLLRKICAKLETGEISATEEALEKLMAYDWPGNVRELENVLTRAVALSRDSRLFAEDIQLRQVTGAEVAPPARPVTLAEAEKAHIVKTLEETDWNISRSARKLAISPTTLRKKINDYGLVRPRE